MDLSTSATQLYDVSDYDPLMKPLDQLTGKSVALLYTSDKFIIAWAALLLELEYIDQIMNKYEKK